MAYQRAGWPLRVWGKEIRQENYGAPIGHILEHLVANHPKLGAEVEAGQIAVRGG